MLVHLLLTPENQGKQEKDSTITKILGASVFLVNKGFKCFPSILMSFWYPDWFVQFTTALNVSWKINN